MIEGAVSESFFALNTTAWAILRHSFRLHPQLPHGLKWRSNPRVQLWDDAGGWSDSAPMSLTVYELWTPETGDQRVVREAVWDRHTDVEALRGQAACPTPTICVRDANVPTDRFHEHLRRVASCNIPLAVLDRDTLDVDDTGSVGFTYFSEDQPTASVQMQWSDGYPDQWQPAIDAVAQLRSFLKSCFPDANPQS